VFLLSKPAPDFIREFLQSQKNQPFSYAHAGASRDQAPRGYDVDHHRVQLGSGAAVFEDARKALQQWKMFDIPWLTLCWPDTPIEANATVAVLASHAGFWSLNACRIVYVMEEHGACERYGFAYGTLPEHGERGEERFTVELRRDDNSVWYEVYAFSRPSFLARLAYPYARLLQRRFARDSMNAMKEAVRR
jgi:uncharacterized protein (UPF0548 family)